MRRMQIIKDALWCLVLRTELKIETASTQLEVLLCAGSRLVRLILRSHRNIHAPRPFLAAALWPTTVLVQSHLA